ncbi:hypothetical protein LEN26_005497 [Aphanomyces euteiches]|nr:hypothetical protein LEN26_005497 [Aphanomyces euteiches]
MKSEEYTPLATPAPGLQTSNIPTVYVQPEAIHVDEMLDRSVSVEGPVFWKAGVFDCLHHIFPNAMMAWLCPCVSLAQITSRLGIYGGYKIVLIGVTVVVVLENLFYCLGDMSPKRHHRVDEEELERRRNRYRLASLLLAMALVAFVTALRTRIRKHFCIQGSEWEDFACSLFCMSCTIAQMSTQTESYTPGDCSFGPRDVLPSFPQV